MDRRDRSLARLVSSLGFINHCQEDSLAGLALTIRVYLKNKSRTTASMRDDVISKICVMKPDFRRRCLLNLPLTARSSTAGSVVRPMNLPRMVNSWTASQTRGAGATVNQSPLGLRLLACLSLTAVAHGADNHALFTTC